jgi:hypothetical protein
MTFIPLSLKHVYEDQLKLKSDNEGNGSEKSDQVVNCEKGENSIRHERREKLDSYKRENKRDLTKNIENNRGKNKKKKRKENIKGKT